MRDKMKRREFLGVGGALMSAPALASAAKLAGRPQNKKVVGTTKKPPDAVYCIVEVAADYTPSLSTDPLLQYAGMSNGKRREVHFLIYNANASTSSVTVKIENFKDMATGNPKSPWANGETGPGAVALPDPSGKPADTFFQVDATQDGHGHYIAAGKYKYSVTVYNNNTKVKSLDPEMDVVDVGVPGPLIPENKKPNPQGNRENQKK